MALDIRGQEKITYTEGTLVSFNVDGKVQGRGIIRGRAVEGPLDQWIVEVTESTIDSNTYPWSCVVLPHTVLTSVASSLNEIRRRSMEQLRDDLIRDEMRLDEERCWRELENME